MYPNQTEEAVNQFRQVGIGGGVAAKELAKNDEGFVYKAWKIPTELSDTSYLADRAAADLKNSKEPFFMHISFLKPHPPYCVSDPWHSLIDPLKLESDILNEMN